MDNFLPKIAVRINVQYGKPYITTELKSLDRKIKREYQKHRKSMKYTELKSIYDRKLKVSEKAFID